MQKYGTHKDYDQIIGKDRYTLDNCPFCKLEEKQDYIIWEGKYWFMVNNKYPYSGNHEHIMALPYTHKQFSTDLNDEELLELKDIHSFAKSYFKDGEYFSFTRETMGSRSVEHVHMHFLAGRLQGKYLRKMLENQGFPIKEDLDVNEKKRN